LTDHGVSSTKDYSREVGFSSATANWREARLSLLIQRTTDNFRVTRYPGVSSIDLRKPGVSVAGLRFPERITRMFKLGMIFSFLLAILLSFSASAETMRPDAERQLAHDIYKQFVEIQSGYTTGATVAEAGASRLRAAGFPDSDIFVGIQA
jgi:hypothetical protein